MLQWHSLHKSLCCPTRSLIYSRVAAWHITPIVCQVDVLQRSLDLPGGWGYVGGGFSECAYFMRQWKTGPFFFFVSLFATNKRCHPTSPAMHSLCFFLPVPSMPERKKNPSLLVRWANKGTYTRCTITPPRLSISTRPHPRIGLCASICMRCHAVISMLYTRGRVWTLGSTGGWTFCGWNQTWFWGLAFSAVLDL